MKRMQKVYLGLVVSAMAVGWLVTAGCPGSGAAGDTMLDSGPVGFDKDWSGRIYSPTLDGQNPEPQVIRDQAGWDAFVAMIPKKQIGKPANMPPSNDPTLTAPAPDFAGKMVLVVFRGANMYARADLANPVVDDGTLHVEVIHPPLGETAMMQSRLDIGVYHAYLMDRHDGPVEFSKPKQPE